MAKFKRFSKTLEKAPGKRVVSITVKPVATNCTGKVWFTDLCLQEGAALTGYHPHTEIFLKKLRDGGKIKPPVWFNGVVRSEETVVLFNGGTTSAPLDVHIYPKADMKAGSIALCQGVGGQRALFPNAIEKDADLALLAEVRSCTKDGEPEPKEGFYQYSAAWDSKHKVTLEDRKSARVLFSMQEMEGYVMPIWDAESEPGSWPDPEPGPGPDPEPDPEPTYDEAQIAIIELDENDYPTGVVSYFLSFSDASSYLADNAQTNYDMRVGNEVDVNTIPAETFQTLTNLHHVTLSDRIARIGRHAFSRCTGLKEVYAPGVKVIEQYCFMNCTSLTHIDTPNITEIQTYAFYHCESLDDVSMGTLIVAIPVYAFGYCYNLKTIELGPVPSILGQAFYGCSSLESISLPNQLLSIGNQAFYGCESLTSITLPNTVTAIGVATFYGCRSLESITLPSTLTSIGNQAFQGCSSLASITLPNTLKTIGTSAFYGCSSLTSITLPNSITAIQANTFYGCSSLVSVTFPSALKTIQGYAFIACGGLTSISLPNTLTFIGASAFSFSYSLKTITIAKPQNSISGAPWGATNATVIWTG